MYKNILVTLDGTSCSEAAAMHGLEIARALGAVVTFLFVMDTNSAWREGVVNIDEARETLSDEGRLILDRAGQVATDMNVRSMGELGEGTPADAIVARAAAFDLVVMGSHGKGLWKRLTVGSVTHTVLHQIQRPLLVVRCSHPEETP